MEYGINEIQSLSFKEGVRSWCVYKHTLKETGQVYIGQTNNIKNRWKPSAYKNCIKFYNAIQEIVNNYVINNEETINEEAENLLNDLQYGLIQMFFWADCAVQG